MSEKLNIIASNLESSQGKIEKLHSKDANIDKLTSKDANIDKLISKDTNVDKLISKDANIDKLTSKEANLSTLTTEFIKLKQQIELLNSELKIVKGYKEIARFSESKVDINTPLYNNNVLVSVPIGTIVAFYGSSIPDGWLLCNGQSINYSYYSKAYDLIGSKVPDLRNRFIRGANTESKQLIAGGNSKIKLSHSNIPKFNSSDSIYTVNNRCGYGSTSHDGYYVDYSSSSGNFRFATFNINLSVGYDNPTEIDINPPYIELAYIIKVK